MADSSQKIAPLTLADAVVVNGLMEWVLSPIVDEANERLLADILSETIDKANHNNPLMRDVIRQARAFVATAGKNPRERFAIHYDTRLALRDVARRRFAEAHDALRHKLEAAALKE